MSEKIKCDVRLQIELNKEDLVYRLDKDFKELINALLHKISKPNFKILEVTPINISKEELAIIRDKLIIKERIEKEKETRDVIIDLGSIVSSVPKDLDEDLVHDYCFNRIDDTEIEVDKIIDEENDEENISFIKKKGDRFDRTKYRKTK